MADAPGGYDLIGDVHGCALTLFHLLEKLGYQKRAGVYRHPSRQLILTGDLIDRGPRIREALHQVRDMVEAGAAQMVMGNHEYHALCHGTPAKAGSPHPYLREHSPRHQAVIEATLEQFANHHADWHAFLGWFLTLPLFLELPGCRVVHACWDHALIDQFRQQHGGNRLTADLLQQSVARNSFVYRLVNRLLHGLILPLPDGDSITGHDGIARSHFRAKFWEEDPASYADLLFQPDLLPVEVAQRMISQEHRARLLHYRADEPPLFIGHYWRTGVPETIRPNLACLDYSAVKSGKLVCYRFDGETRLDSAKFVWQTMELDQPRRHA